VRTLLAVAVALGESDKHVGAKETVTFPEVTPDGKPVPVRNTTEVPATAVDG
jgi:hypothetical protein